MSLEAAQLAAAWCEFLEAHARKVYAGVLQKDLQAAHALAEKMRGGTLTHEMTVREVYRNGWALLQTPDDVYGGLRCLERYGWLRITEVSTGNKGRPREVLTFHPTLTTPAIGFVSFVSRGEWRFRKNWGERGFVSFVSRGEWHFGHFRGKRLARARFLAKRIILTI